MPLRSFAAALRPGGWAVISLDHPFGRPIPDLPDRIGEARPGADALRRWPAELADAAVGPSFIVYRLRLADTAWSTVPGRSASRS